MRERYLDWGQENMSVTAGAARCTRHHIECLSLVFVVATSMILLGGCVGSVKEGGASETPSGQGALVITNVLATAATTSSVQVGWKTNLASTSAIQYGTTTGYGFSSPVNSAMVTNHQVAVTGIKAGVLYHYRVVSADSSGTAVSGDATFSTGVTPGGNTTGPTVTLTAPANGATVSGIVNVTASASDSSGVAWVLFQVDGGIAGGQATAAPYAYVWNTTKSGNGTHRLNAIAQDMTGNSTTSASVTVTVNNTPAGAFSISGTVSPTAGGNGATIVLNGAASATTLVSSSGAYSFTGLANGIYAVSASRAGYAFSPAVQPATINGANITGLNFTATPVSQTFSISGTISPPVIGSGAAVILSGAVGATTTAGSSGAYMFTGLPSGNYVVAPSSSGATFSPAQQSVTVGTANITGVNFTASTNTQMHSALLSWDASSSTVAGYNVYRSTVSGSGFAKMNSGLVGGLIYTDSTVQSGITYYYVTRAVDSAGNESANSNQVSANIP
jgi:Bacterial Ig domain